MRQFRFYYRHTSQEVDKNQRSGDHVAIIKGVDFEQALRVFRNRYPEDNIQYIESGEPF